MVKNRSNQKKEDLILYAILIVPTIWFALLLAPCLGGNLFTVMTKLTERIQDPLHIEWCENSIRRGGTRLRQVGITQGTEREAEAKAEFSADQACVHRYGYA